MKKNIRNILSCIVLILIIAAMWLCCETILRPVYSDMSLATIEAFHSIEDNSQDVIVYGSSHSWRGVNTKQLYDDYGIAAFNYSCMWQRFNTTRLFLTDSLLTQKPKVAVIDVGNMSEILKDTDVVGEVYYTRKLKMTEDKKKYLKECFGNEAGRYVTYAIPLVMYHSGWNDLSEKSFSDVSASAADFVESRGYFGFENSVPVAVNDGSDYWEDVIPDATMTILDDMVNTCHANEIEVVLITVPYYSNEFIYRDALKEYASEKGCRYIDFFELSTEIGLDGENDFSDTDHLNHNGACKVTKYLGEVLKENYDL